MEVSFRQLGGAACMGFVILFAAAWLSVFLFYSMKKSLTLIENTFVYLVMLAVGIHFNWIIDEELKHITLTKDALLYAGLMITRLVTLPMIFVLMANGVARSRSMARALLLLGAALAVILGLRAVMLAYRIVTFVEWNLFYDALMIMLLQAICLVLLKLYRIMLRREVSAA
jgi:hypothetical protein